MHFEKTNKLPIQVSIGSSERKDPELIAVQINTASSPKKAELKQVVIHSSPTITPNPAKINATTKIDSGDEEESDSDESYNGSEEAQTPITVPRRNIRNRKPPEKFWITSTNLANLAEYALMVDTISDPRSDGNLKYVTPQTYKEAK